MSSADAQVAFNRSNGFSEPVEAQDHFSQQFNLEDPDKARSSYQRIMHEHTMQQYQSATASSRRRSANETQVPALLSDESRGSVSSTDS